MHFCRADIMIGGDVNNIAHAGDFSPVSWPEILVLQFVHGDDCVTNIEPFTRVAQPPRAERQRLLFKYGEKVILDVFARQPPSEMEAPKVKLSNGIPWFNPITMRQEITGEEDADAPIVAVADEPDDGAADPAPVEEYYDAPPEPTRRRR